jgi:hypothetical protein
LKLERMMVRRMGIRPLGRACVLALLLAASPAGAQQGGEALINDVIQKGIAGESENGFCATTRWRIERSTADTGNFYERSQRGSWKAFQDTYSGANAYCGFLNIDNVTQPGDGGRCVHAQMWWCHFGKQCHHRRYRGCRTATGPYKWND